MAKINKSHYRFTKGAKEDISILNTDISHAQLVIKLRGGVVVNHPSGTIKSGNLIFSLKDNLVLGVALEHTKSYIRNYYFRCDKCFDSKKIQVGDPCDFCDEGCNDCKDGLQFKTIVCPNCSEQHNRGYYERQDSFRSERQQRNGNRWGIQKKTNEPNRSKISTRNRRAL